MDPHYPWVPRERDIEPFRPGGVSDLRVARLWHAVSHLNHGDGEHTVSAADLDRITDLYDAEVRRTDEAVGRLLAGLDTGPDGDTLVALVGDHGTELADHGGFSHGPRKLYDEVVRVPLLVAGPAVPAAREERAVSLLDVPTTLCRAAGVEPPESTLAFGTGSLLADPTTGGPVPRSPAVTEVVFDFDPVTGANADNGHLTAVVDWPWKLVVNAERGTHELYHLGADPEERTDRAEEKSFVVDALLDVVDRHRDRVAAGARSTAARVAEPDRAEATDVSARLESLGYL
jgi:arylsulfatase A-like enzyme